MEENQSTTTTATTTVLEYLVVTDLHYSQSGVTKLIKWSKEELEGGRLKSLQGIIVCGDVVNANLVDKDNLTSPEVDEQEFYEILNSLRSIHKKIWFIPGNHDPACLFEPDSDFITKHFKEEPTKVINFHNKIITLAPNLVLVGLGGSVDSPLYDQPDKVYWKGYPYTETEIGDKFQSLLTRPELNPDPSNSDESHTSKPDILLVTHTGPAYINTTDLLHGSPPDGPRRVQSGSVTMSQSLKDYSHLHPSSSHPIIVHLHGHSHSGLGLSSQLPHHSTINPGALKDNRFLQLTLSFTSSKTGLPKWSLRESRFITL